MSAVPIPSLREELDRKAFETVESLYHQLDIGKISVAQFSTGLDAVFGTCAGLVAAGTIDLISAGSRFVAANADQFVVKRTFQAESGVALVLTRRLGADQFVVQTYERGTLKGEKVMEYMTAKQASDAMDALAHWLNERSYTEL